MIKNYINYPITKNIIITTSRNSNNKTKTFTKILCSIIPSAIKIPRGNLKLSQLFQICYLKNFKVLIIVHEYQKNPNGLYLVYFTKGPIMYLKLSHLNMKNLSMNYKKKSISYSGWRVIIKHNVNKKNYNILQLFKNIFLNFNKCKNNILFLFFYKNCINIRCYLKYHLNKVIEVS
uniref:U3 snoRNP protein IMP4 n=1 Tax=Lotharella vacuolata TaxID=74820 RepID=A0A0H5BGY2_9EUKA|nr:U3 snoRNP protein IMP4 [Lotharella vacuolata]